ncbi:M20 family metallo-hydrolase [Acidisoma cellulosilytica]|uniref:M20 family metallo-hydrolase n=1 Tax=Acidisoma cellulosilyticum TaxID=2802395 RepID=A0A963YXM6_9PROT|nr:M20 family metallo-hydrolase [Acidisoma cellulosilyticum]MCB8878974.1 M20 family metallo-hydrolase [Acidisoma cellulosilyticum]
MDQGLRLAAAVSETRQWDRLMRLARIGAIAGDGVNRQALTALDREARRLMIAWAEEAGASVSVDDAANLWFRVEGRLADAAPVLTGSHMDSQPAGGRFDGMYGVMAGLEVLCALKDSGETLDRPLEVVAWTNEEGSRFAPGCMGSMAWAGVKPLAAFAETRDAEGVRFADALAEQLAAEADLPRRPLGGTVHAYIEAHIEQGPKLEAEGLDIGVVTGIQGSRWFTVTVMGDSTHAGTTPVSLRRDAMQGAVRAIMALNTLTADPTDVLRFTVGSLVVEPGSSNSVAGMVRFTIDLRHPDAAVLAEKGDAIAESIARVIAPCDAKVEERFSATPLRFDPELVASVQGAADALGLRWALMPSGAFHDAQLVASAVPSAMIFVPSHKGISHNPAEFTSATQLAAGTRSLAASLAQQAKITK